MSVGRSQFIEFKFFLSLLILAELQPHQLGEGKKTEKSCLHYTYIQGRGKLFYLVSENLTAKLLA